MRWGRPTALPAGPSPPSLRRDDKASGNASAGKRYSSRSCPPTCDTAYFLETVSARSLRPATQAEIVARAEDTDARLILCDHIHIQREVAFGKGRLVLNPGSVGLPGYENNEPFPQQISNASPHARYALLDDANGNWAASFHIVACDWEQAAQTAERNDRPDWAKALRTGRL
ncbi:MULTISPECIES: metallophosphoesterase family protein [Asaia]|uniref:metallophosphoesterase family protein n=1 Tax=Asaia TaxID=91914 RepID=UPI00255798E3|nr:hypothetical protein [Asaia sp. HumB]MDL2171673.1 hypothetical protein [Asaia sp. HumB]